MTGLAIASIVVGMLVVATRAPLVFAPAETLAAFRTLIASDARLRALGALVSVLGLALALSAPQVEGSAAAVVGGLGWLMGAGAVLLIVLPRFYREMAQTVMDAIEGIAPVIGFLGVGIGVGFLYLGVAVF